MQDVHTTLRVGSVVQGRYRVEKLLGKGGFGAVYLVRDQRVKGNLFALKELVDNRKNERAHFELEGEILKRLDHASLPRIYRIFEDNKGSRAYILMDYIAGLNLEELRQKQPNKVLPLARALHLMAPIVAAVGYLHKQQPPIVHRDIKPANIIIPPAEDTAFLVDFGIAKEYDTEATTTAIRRCSPGYGAPEQYATGTNPQTDLYGLAATLYALLTGEVPIDALYRMTQMGGRGKDPLQSVTSLAPAVPEHVSEAIMRAMEIRYEDRFATVEEFWQAIHAQPIPGEDDFATIPDTDTDTEEVVLTTDMERVKDPVLVASEGLLVAHEGQADPVLVAHERPVDPVLSVSTEDHEAPSTPDVSLLPTDREAPSTPDVSLLPTASQAQNERAVPLTPDPSTTGSTTNDIFVAPPRQVNGPRPAVIIICAVALVAILSALAFSSTLLPFGKSYHAHSTTNTATTTAQTGKTNQKNTQTALSAAHVHATATASAAVSAHKTATSTASTSANQTATATAAATSTTGSTPPPAQTPASTTPPAPPAANYPALSTTYNGTISDQFTTPATTASMQLTQMQLNNGNLSGQMYLGSGLLSGHNLTGTVSTTSAVQFTVPDPSGQYYNLLFQGTVNADKSMSGTYCGYTGQYVCSHDQGYGTWTVSP